MLRVTGEVVRYERKPWAMEGKTGITRKARVLVGKADFVDITFPEALPEPREGDNVDLGVTVTAPSGRVKITVVGDFLALVPEVAAPAKIKAAV